MLQVYKYKSNFAKYYICVNTLDFTMNELILIWNFAYSNKKVVNPNLFWHLCLTKSFNKKGTIRSVK